MPYHTIPWPGVFCRPCPLVMVGARARFVFLAIVTIFFSYHTYPQTYAQSMYNCSHNSSFYSSLTNLSLPCCCRMFLKEFRCGLLAVVLLVSGGVTLLFSGQKSDDQQQDFPIHGFLLTLLSGMLAGLKWTLSQVCAVFLHCCKRVLILFF